MIHNSDVTVFFFYTRWRKDRKTVQSKKSFCANQKVDSVVPKEIMSDIHPSQNTHHTTLIKYRFVLQTKMS